MGDDSVIHATAVALDGRGLVIRGPSGAGKSSLALQLMAVGAGLVADDRVVLRREGELVLADAPPALRGRIEARGLGILRATAVGPVPVVAVCDLGDVETDRLPVSQSCDLLGVAVPLIRPLAGGAWRNHLYAGLRQFLLAGREET